MNFRKSFALGLFVAIFYLRGFALTNGPVQQEYSTFEPVDVTDMVNLPTGDFSYAIPVGDVKGPAGVGYPIVLSYHGGIMNDQEASWVGLGWSLNVGAINRAVRGMPDDYQYDCAVQYVHASDQGWSMDVGGGIGPVSATVGWSESGKKGFSFDGLTSIGVNYKLGPVAVGATANLRNQSLTVGVGYQIGSGMVGVGLTLNSDGSCSNPSLNFSALSGSGPNAKSLASFSINSKGNIGVGVGFGDGNVGAGGGFGSMSMSSGGMHASGWGFGITIPIYMFRIDFAYSRWSWQYSDMEYGYNYGYLFQSINNGYQQVQTNDPVFNYNFPTLQKAHLAYNGMATVDFLKKSVPSSAVNVDHVYDRSEFIGGDDGFTLPSQDVYMATGQGMGGVFQPFRHNSQKSVSESSSDFLQYNGIVGAVHDGEGTPGSPFNYNNNFFNADETHFSESFNNGLSFRMLGESALNLIDNCSETYDLENSFDNIDKISSNPENTYGTRILPVFGTDPMFPGKLNGFTLTDQEGKTYYYTLPLFSLAKVTYSSEHQYPPESGGYFAFNQDNNYSAMLGAYATTWLLTAVTGPDYIKMTTDDKAPALPHNGDLGYWVAFRYEYGDTVVKDGDKIAIKKTDKDHYPISKASYRWRVPYYDDKALAQQNNYPLPHVEGSGSNKYSSSFGIKEVTYLKSIETPTEVAYFRTSERLDGYGVDDGSYPKFVPDPILASDINFHEDHLLDYWNKWNRSMDKMTNNIMWDGYEQTGQPTIRLVPWIETAGTPSDALLSSCYTIRFNVNDLNVDGFYALKEGTSIARIEFAGQAEYMASWPWRWSSHNEYRSAGGAIEIRKDTYNCYTDNAHPRTLTAISTAEDPAHLLNYDNGHVPFAKCFYAKIDPTDNTKIIVYITGYKTEETAMPLSCELGYSHQWNQWFLSAITDLHIKSAFRSGSLEKYLKRNPLIRYAKKLDEIAWYSKSKYPSLVSGLDPENNSEKYSEFKPDPYPKPYKRAKFVYNYELAGAATTVPPGWVNSMATNRGRLTLKMVRAEAGDPDASVSMPPYIFSYQGVDIPYSGFNKIDPWGFTKTTASNIAALSDEGVNWNLEQILLPSCGSIKVKYERDCVNSGLATIYKLFRDNRSINNDLCHDFEYRVKPTRPWADYLDNYDVVGQNDKVLELSSVSGIVKGSYCMLNRNYDTSWAGRGGSYTENKHQFSSLYRIDTVYEGNHIILDHLPGVMGALPLTSIYVLKPQPPMYCDGIRVKSIECVSATGSANTKYVYPGDGIIQMLPNEIVPQDFSKTSKNEHLYGRFNYFIDFVPFSSEVSRNYNNGNSGVIYPTVEVSQTQFVEDGDDDRNVGFKRYNFYSPYDKIIIDSHGTTAPIIDIKYANKGSTTSTPVKQIWDRSGIVGMTKKVEIFNDLSQLVYSKENLFTFSENLATTGGVVHNSLSPAFTDNSKPLGLVNQRSIAIDHLGTTKSVCDVINSLPFLTGVIEKTQDVTTETDFGMYNARTGSPIITVSTNSDGSKKLDMNVPYNFIANDRYQLAELKKKNMFSLPGGSLVANIAHLIGIRTLSDIDYSSVIGTVDSIKSASSMKYAWDADPSYTLQITVPGGTPLSYPQSRFYRSESDQWKAGGAFTWPLLGGSDYWTRLSNVTRADHFTRPRTEINTANIPSTAIYHPKLDAVIGVVQNANYYESSVFTGDYDDVNPLTVKSNYFDYENGWEKPTAVTTPSPSYTIVTDADNHFGKKCIEVANAYGPTCNFKISQSKNYVLSAWVKVNSGTLNLYVEYRNSASPYEITSWPILLSTLSSTVYDNVSSSIAANGSWTYQEVKIDGSRLSSATGYVRVWIGNPGQPTSLAHIDDIRFHPEKSLVSSFYYDQELDLPITFVDANNKAKYSKYDEFGRVVEKGVKR